MEISNGINIIDLSLYIGGTLIIADTHVGLEESMKRQGILIPMDQHEKTIKRLEKIFEKLKKKNLEVKEIIINGDLKHEFGRISETEWRHALSLIDFLLERSGHIILLKGNHDKILEPLAAKRSIEVRDFHVLNNIYICHGDKIPKEIAQDTIIIGHEHPAIGLRENARIETFKCFLKGRWKDKELIVMPSFNLAAEGSDILKENPLSPFLKQDLHDFEVYIIDEKREPLYFGKIRNLIE